MIVSRSHPYPMKTKLLVLFAVLLLALSGSLFAQSTPPVTPPPFAMPVNMSVMVPIGTDGVTVGFVADPGATRESRTRFLVRAVGPSLQRFNVGGTAERPRLTIHGVGAASRVVENWSADAVNRAAVQDASNKTGAFPLEVGALDAAAVIDVPPGSVTVSVSPGVGRGGTVLLEIYLVRD